MSCAAAIVFAVPSASWAAWYQVHPGASSASSVSSASRVLQVHLVAPVMNPLEMTGDAAYAVRTRETVSVCFMHNIQIQIRALWHCFLVKAAVARTQLGLMQHLRARSPWGTGT